MEHAYDEVAKNPAFVREAVHRVGAIDVTVLQRSDEDHHEAKDVAQEGLASLLLYLVLLFDVYV